jgi:peptidoglycan hydrolase-like protein with peptidoglycan-binding domain
MTGYGDEPELSSGDSGEPVLQLQTRLQALNLFDGPIDGDYGETTRDAVLKLQEEAGVDATGRVDEQTWRALADVERRAGVANPYAEDAGGDVTGTPVGTLSEDQHWRWDGEQWQANEEPPRVEPRGGDTGGGQLSADGQWLWDGNQWQPVPQ